MSNKHHVDHAETTSGPSSKVLRLGSSDVELMAVDPSVTASSDMELMAVDSPLVAASIGRDLPAEALKVVGNLIRDKLKEQKKLDDSTKGTDAAFQNFLSMVHSALFAASFLVGSFPRSFLDSVNQLSPKTIRTNATKQRASGFVDMFKEAVNGNDWRLWGPVVSHGTFIDLCFYYRQLISLNL